MSFEKEDLTSRLIEFGREALSKGLVWGNSGNISHRLDNKKFLISGSGAHLGKLKEENFVVVDLENKKIEGGAKPSIETKMHTEIYRIKMNVEAVFHSQPFFTTLISCTDMEVDKNLFPESMAYIDKIGRVPYHHPGSHELAIAVSEKGKECDVILLGNHGAICTAKNLEEALLKTETLEMLCKLIVFSRLRDIEINYLSQDIKNDFLRHLEKMSKI
jgi:ribulose-5-phosphate 4-epimerase/fuculose-1-phosphate aldolase